jgi:hypothetical protein
MYMFRPILPSSATHLQYTYNNSLSVLLLSHIHKIPQKVYIKIVVKMVCTITTRPTRLNYFYECIVDVYLMMEVCAETCTC